MTKLQQLERDVREAEAQWKRAVAYADEQRICAVRRFEFIVLRGPGVNIVFGKNRPGKSKAKIAAAPIPA